MMNDSTIFTTRFLKATGVRAIKTVCQTAVALIGTNAIGVTDVNWAGVASGAALAGIVSVLTSVATGLPEVNTDEHYQRLMRNHDEQSAD